MTLRTFCRSRIRIILFLAILKFMHINPVTNAANTRIVTIVISIIRDIRDFFDDLNRSIAGNYRLHIKHRLFEFYKRMKLCSKRLISFYKILPNFYKTLAFIYKRLTNFYKTLTDSYNGLSQIYNVISKEGKGASARIDDQFAMQINKNGK
ncbi:hypothetical protein SD70_19305 [Gordoniibacillus kamchatkensis]|uniref:Uncharacterized protein n=1 Tax=Gordoniibacillus kamchatkensis TaxID=1590651 RepID=A0ABR5AER5_9BACL|nr:hypothetical protein SD70_19305 [Paenibacillus sp. VKM B-2647]